MKTHCVHGHEYTEANTKRIKSTKPGHFKRQCRKCKAIESSMAGKAKHQAPSAPPQEAIS